MLRKIRIISASLFFLFITLLFLDFTGTIHQWLGWVAKIQLVPAILVVNTIVIVALVLLTLLFGRVYCSVICPLGIFQDAISNISGRRKGKKNRFSYSPAISWLRYSFLGLFVIGLVAGISIIVSLLDPYATYGRIAANFFAPLYRLGNNLLAFFAEKADSYAFYTTDVWIKSWITFGVAALTLVIVFILAWQNGRTYCNTICPVGTALGFLSKFSLFRIQFKVDKCTNCKACERACKASCIDTKTKHIDHSRCVTCFNCIEKCKFDGLNYSVSFHSKTKNETEQNSDNISRRNALSILGLLALGSTLKAQQLHVDGGLAAIEDKKIPNRNTPVVPQGALGTKNIKQHCTACQLCISACPNNVLRPSNKLSTLMQPEMSFERGYCRPECVECSHVCPTSAIREITTAEKSATAIGTAVWIQDNCVVNTDKIQCKKCSQACPTGAITLIENEPDSDLKIPVIDKSLCIGCGACEYLCPARPFSAIYVEGNVRHHTV
ncbi:MAG: 4Fe-4S dicluster domain-containing protein [Lentimicrobiaceae bacterium]|jgi:ferredoxin|nr:4Fe-4S dicluster domain-containing protein [Lentimicrobiaceae bacterium]